MQDAKTKPAGEGKVTGEIRQYIEKRIQLLTLTITEEVSLVLAYYFQRIAGMLLVCLAFLFFWLAVGFFLGEWLGRYSLGFLIASVPLFIAGAVFVNSKSKTFTEKIQAEMIQKILESFERDSEEDEREGRELHSGEK